jgi:hypothetical protein
VGSKSRCEDEMVKGFRCELALSRLDKTQEFGRGAEEIEDSVDNGFRSSISVFPMIVGSDR